MEAKKRRGVIVPHEIVEEIMVKVPVKSLVRFKAVSKEWRGIIESKYFVDKHKSLGEGQARIVRVQCVGSKRRRGLALENMVFLPINRVAHSSPYRRIKHLHLRPRDFKFSEPCDGLFCIYTKDRVLNLVNPATTSSRILPDPEPEPHPSTLAEDLLRYSFLESTLVGLGEENDVSPRYKLVWFTAGHKEAVNNTARCKVFSLDSNTWRCVDPPNCRVYYEHPIIHLDGVLYCFSFDMKESTYYKYHTLNVLAFDLHTETFQSFSVPPDIGSKYLTELSMRVLNHRLCIFRKYQDRNRKDLFFKIWGLDINKRSWEIMYSIELSCLQPKILGTTIIPVATINNYLIFLNGSLNSWGLYGSETHILRPSFTTTCIRVMSYFETLVSVYQ